MFYVEGSTELFYAWYSRSLSLLHVEANSTYYIPDVRRWEVANSTYYILDVRRWAVFTVISEDLDIVEHWTAVM